MAVAEHLLRLGHKCSKSFFIWFSFFWLDSSLKKTHFMRSRGSNELSTERFCRISLSGLSTGCVSSLEYKLIPRSAYVIGYFRRFLVFPLSDLCREV